MEPTERDALLLAAKPLIDLAIAEDIGPGDATSLSTLAPEAVLHGRIVAKSRGVIAGLPVAEAVFCRVDPEITFTAVVRDGQAVVPGELVAEVSGPGTSLLAAERTALNFLQRLSGIATKTRSFVAAVATYKAAILDTRKTLPGYRMLDKYAVRMGGGQNHRMSLYDMLLIKDNHIDGAAGITAAVNQARIAYPTLPIEVEVRNMDELAEALAVTPPLDRILLDNMTLDQMREAVRLTAEKTDLEASGNVTLATVADIAETGVDFISVGALTHSVQALDLSMKVQVARDRDLPALTARIKEIKAAFGKKLIILGHHYQRDEIINLADYKGDSLQLSRTASQTDAEFIVFCGVHFMAETAATLSKPGQHVLIPDMNAGCYLAETASLPGVQAAWDALDTALGNADAEVTPITYVNSTNALKAFCGEHGGSVCTSSNAGKVLQWAFEQRSRVFFFPDQHLGRNTALQMGMEGADILLWDIRTPPNAEQIRRARVILWPGVCNVHQRFRPKHVHGMRARYPGIRVIVHPESKAEIVALADDAGSTAYIIQQIEKAPAGTSWAVGTESRLVYRLQTEHPEQFITSLADVPPYCANMSQITLQNLAETLEALQKGDLRNEVTVDAQSARWAMTALQRMLAL
ncbi:MAG: quinolinate synthase NadA [Anaerolineales bacterium]|nr:MAG: quinolinate synthase NadA [Anaerolineales bacterium]